MEWIDVSKTAGPGHEVSMTGNHVASLSVGLNTQHNVHDLNLQVSLRFGEQNEERLERLTLAIKEVLELELGGVTHTSDASVAELVKTIKVREGIIDGPKGNPLDLDNPWS